MAHEAKKLATRKLTLAASATLFAAALPSSVLAIGVLAGNSSDSASQFLFTPAAADPEIAELVARTGTGHSQMTRFTPAGAVASSGVERSVTASVRVDQKTAQALSGANTGPQQSNSLRIAPTRYNLGIARGYSSFVAAPQSTAEQNLTARAAPVLSRSLSDAEMPELSSYAPRDTDNEEESRFAARVELDQSRSATSREAQNSVSDQMLDVGGSFRLTNNLDITAGVRVEQDRDIVPLPDVDQQDSQAVYIGTQIRF